MAHSAKVIVYGSPISKSNFKLYSVRGRAILPINSGKYHDRYAVYESEIAYQARSQNPNIVLTNNLIAVLKVFYKSEKRHPDTNNITKSIFDGIEKSGLILNDSQIVKFFVEENYDKENPRFELELYDESLYKINISIQPKDGFSIKKDFKAYEKENIKIAKENKKRSTCSICLKSYSDDYFVKSKNSAILVCKKCFIKL